MPRRHPFHKALIAVFAALITLTYAAPAYAITIVPSCARRQDAKAPGLNCVLETFENIAEIILGVTGSFALLMFVYGGFTLLTSGGVDEKVMRGKTAIRNAIIGILIILLSGYLIRYTIATVTGGSSLTEAGEKCGEAVDVNGESRVPRWYTIGEEEICAHSCNQLDGYACTTETAGKSCLVGLCTGSQNKRCCPL